MQKGASAQQSEWAEHVLLAQVACPQTPDTQAIRSQQSASPLHESPVQPQKCEQ